MSKTERGGVGYLISCWRPIFPIHKYARPQDSWGIVWANCVGKVFGISGPNKGIPVQDNFMGELANPNLSQNQTPAFKWP